MLVIQDITKRKNAEEALQQSEELFRLAFHTSPDAFNLNRASDGSYIGVNEGFTRLMGYTHDEAVGKTSLELNIWVDPEDRRRFVRRLKNKRAASEEQQQGDGYQQQWCQDYKPIHNFVSLGWAI